MDDIDAATLYKMEGPAAYNGRRRYSYDSEGNEITNKEYHDKYKACSKSGETFAYTREYKFDNERYEVCSVFITIRK
ncbi:MAG TPA: hypothetical protein ENH82_13940 [bacterium]|nr:hypothetical protein [bacterium]